MTSGNITIGSIPGPYYRKKIWNGGNNGPGENAYTYQINEASLIPVKYRVFGATTWRNGSMNTFKPSYSLVSGMPNDVLNKATQKVWEELAQSKFHAGVFAGEFHESYKMLSGSVRTIALAISAAKRGKWERALRILNIPLGKSAGGAAANSYMMVHFGVLPLLSDMSNMYELMKTKYKVVHHVKKSCSYREERNKTLNGVTWRNFYKCVAEIRGEVHMLELGATDRLSCYDLAGVAWELTRLSWLIDWVVPIGNFLQAVNAHNMTEGKLFWTTRMETVRLDSPKKDGSYEIEPFDLAAFQQWFLPGAQNARSQMSALPWVFPTIKNPLGDNLSRWTTSVALLRQSVGR